MAAFEGPAGRPRAALVGFGQIAQGTHVPALAAAGCALVAVVEPQAARRQEAATALGCPTFACLSDLWGSGLDVDFVDICSPPGHHMQALRAAAAAGVHALCEKPLVLEMADITALEALGAGGAWAVGYVHNWLCAPAVRAMLACVAAGEIGRPTRLEATCLRTRPAAGRADGARPWRQERAAAGGGILMDHGWHGLGILLRLAGVPARLLGAELAGGADGMEHTADVSLGFDGGARGRFFATWQAGRRHNCLTAGGPGGVVTLADDLLEVAVVGRPARRQRFAESLADGGYRPSWTTAAVLNFVASLRQPRLRRAAMAEAAQITTLVAGAYAAGVAPAPTALPA